MNTNVVVASKTVVALAALVATTLPMLPPSSAAQAAATATTTATGLGSTSCTRTCGNISIPYPFGVEPGCYHAAGFNLTCKQQHSHHHHHQPPKLFLGDGTVQVLDISVEHNTVCINSPGVQLQYDSISQIGPANGTWGLGLPKTGPYFLSESASMVEAIGCSIQVSILGGLNNSLVSSCTAICPLIFSKGGGVSGTIGNGNCTGIGCCRASIVVGYSSYTIQIERISGPGWYVPTSVFIVDQSFFVSINSNGERIPGSLTTATLDWIIGTSTCPTNNKTAPECLSSHSYCQNSSSLGHGGYTCQCANGYQGNPYVHGGCQDIDECNHKEAYSCYGICQNFPGSFHCQCPEGSSGNYSIKGGCITIKNSFTGLSIGLGVGGGTGLLLLALGGPYIMHKIKLQKANKVKQRLFKQNHGLLLQQLISHNTDISERMIITLSGIEKATNNFDKARIVGGGGHGVVFKGILDLQVVAVKKSKIVVQREINEFINEVAVLSQVNHRNVVKLLGCCLETEVPLLVYEFISNGTLCHHLHIDGPISLPWDDRMRIATEVAKALSYLHSAASMPVFHRDIKSANILLDDALTAKVSDFGASRYIPIDQTGVTTVVQGTMGYLDPMYYYTGRLTDKSDVFSFGVLLVELLTRKKPYVYRSVDNDGLVSHFVSLLAEGKLVDIIDPQVMEEKGGEIQEVITLAAMCTKLKGEDRPTMREVEMTLESLLVNKKRLVQYNGTPMSNCGDEATTHYMAIGRDCNEASRQYTMEEEIWLSASYPR
ncbi:wall-associated receptor kinase 2 [Sorghum bicolor]|uniref:wall-associated receptor kinase 2 n=1 Tax=Sorghum bicolor TaxID=4558 RepID=UPI000B424DA3|nr:wall-associated receptor kinase 2 [Sorghum bicolor]|eukprot:XP_021321421.1 wall-associated receptor kinase 2 [Sorghum bicolor]